jgi:hypothetical protein
MLSMAGLPRLSSSKATQSTEFRSMSMKTSHQVGRAGKRLVYTRRGYWSMNLNVSLSPEHSSSLVTHVSSFRSDQITSLRKMGNAVLPARINSPMVMRTKYEFWKGIMLASSRDMPELLNADTPLKTPSHHGLMPFLRGGSGWLLLIQAPRARQPRSCQSTK